jgi:hypothetical protein
LLKVSDQIGPADAGPTTNANDPNGVHQFSRRRSFQPK